jgi:hypothetical protein
MSASRESKVARLVKFLQGTPTDLTQLGHNTLRLNMQQLLGEVISNFDAFQSHNSALQAGLASTYRRESHFTLHKLSNDDVHDLLWSYMVRLDNIFFRGLLTEQHELRNAETRFAPSVKLVVDSEPNDDFRGFFEHTSHCMIKIFSIEHDMHDQENDHLFPLAHVLETMVHEMVHA